jgi:hypothetical protein
MRKFVLIGALAGVGGVVFAQGTRSPVAGSSQDALLAEVRALRAEIHQAASAGLRMQLLVARLQLQEQRVIMAGRQLLEVQNALASVRQEIAGETSRVEQLEKTLSRAASQGQPELQQTILEAKTQIQRQQRHEQQLQVQESDGLKAVNDAQAQWMDFSKRLDELERSAPADLARAR